MSNFNFSWKSCMKPWIIHKLGNFAWENCYRDITDVVVVQVIAATRITPVDEHGFGGTALVHDNEMRLTCNFTEEAIREFELKEESTSGCEFNSDLKNALVALRRYRIVPTFTSNEGDSIFTVVVYSFTLKSFTKLSAGINDTRMAHKHYRIVKKLKELWSQWKNDGLAFVSDDSDSGSATTEVTLSQMIQFMEEAEKREDQNGKGKNGERRILGKHKDAEEEGGQGTKEDQIKEIHNKNRNKENRWEISKEGTSNVNNSEAGGSKSVSRDKIHERSRPKTDHITKVSQHTTEALFEIPLSLLDKLRCAQHEKCLHLQPSSSGGSSEAGGETSSHSLNELLGSIPVVCYTCIPDSAKQGLPEGLTPLDMDVPWDQEDISNQREEEASSYIATSSSCDRSCDSSQQKASESMEVLQWPPGSSSSKNLQPSVEDRSVASLEPSNKGSEHTDGIEGGEKVSPAVEVSGDHTSSQSEAQNSDNSKTDKFVNNVDMDDTNTKESAAPMNKSRTEGENVITDEERLETVEIMATQPFEVDEHQPSSMKPSNEMKLVGKESSENLLQETQPFDITALTQRSPGNKKGEPGKLTDGDTTENVSQEFEPVATESEEILSNEHDKAFVETQSTADSMKPGSQDSLPFGETGFIDSTDKNAPNSNESAEADAEQISTSKTGISSVPENNYNSDISLEDIFDLNNLTCASPLVGLESQNAKLKGDLPRRSNSPVVSSSGGQVIPSCSDIPVLDHKKGRGTSASENGTFHEARRKGGSKRNSKRREANSPKIDHKQDSDILVLGYSSSRISASSTKDDDIDWSWILHSPANTQKLDELLGESVSSLEKPNENSRDASKPVQRNSQKSVVSEFLKELQTLQCKCGESLSDSCDSSSGHCQSSRQKDEHELNESERQSTNKRMSGENQSNAGESLQEISINRHVSDSVDGYAATSDRRRVTKNPSSPLKKTRKRKYRNMTIEELSIPKKKMIENRLLKWITSNYAPKKSKQK